MGDVIFCLLLAFTFCISLLIGKFIEIKLEKIKPLKKWQEYLILYGFSLPLFSLIHIIYYPFGLYVLSIAEFIVFALFVLMFLVVIFLSVSLFDYSEQSNKSGGLISVAEFNRLQKESESNA